MKLNYFIQKHAVRLDKATLSVCREGTRQMSLGSDLHHDLSHVEKIFDHLDFLLEKNKKLGKKINFKVLIPAICWHDVWISRQVTKNFFQLLWNQVVEGRKSAEIFTEYSKNLLSTPQLSEINYCIVKHSSVQITPPLTLESKILIDLDKLELWNSQRFINRGDSYTANKAIYQKKIVRFYLIYSHKMGMYFKELEENLKRSSQEFWHSIEK